MPENRRRLEAIASRLGAIASAIAVRLEANALTPPTSVVSGPTLGYVQTQLISSDRTAGKSQIVLVTHLDMTSQHSSVGSGG